MRLDVAVEGSLTADSQSETESCRGIGHPEDRSHIRSAW